MLLFIKIETAKDAKSAKEFDSRDYVSEILRRFALTFLS